MKKKYAIASVEVINNTKMIENVRYKPEAAKLIDNGNIDEFTNRYGDTFVKAITTEGSYYGVFSFSSRDETKLQNIFTEFTGNYAVMVAGNTSIASQMKDKLKQVDLEVSNYQIGGTDVDQPISFDEVIERAKKFPQQVNNENGRPVPKIMSIIDYKTLPSPKPPNFIDIQKSKSVLDQYYNKRKEILDMINKINFIRKNPDYFENPDDNKLRQFLTQLNDSLNKISENASKCVNDVKKCDFIDVVTPENINLPRRKQIDHIVVSPIISQNPNIIDLTHLLKP